MPSMPSSAPGAVAHIRGKIREHADLSQSNWFRVGGHADILFKPEDAEDLALYMEQKPPTMPHMVLGVGSNLILRDGGIEGVVIRLGRNFTYHRAFAEDGQQFVASGAGALGGNLARWCEGAGLAGLEFLSGIPGTVGGAVAMNAGAYGCEVKDVLHSVEFVTASGQLKRVQAKDIPSRYRFGGLPEGAIVTEAVFCVRQDAPNAVAARMADIQASREATQPIRERTGGSTFKNPIDAKAEGKKAWQLVDEAGCRGLTLGGAQVSEKHCNFLINTGMATAAELEALGEQVRERVQAHCGVLLEWEIKRIGRKRS